jgi:mannitol-1-phosphate/altronate dehydrogenase
MRWQAGRDDAGERFAVDDPLAATTARLIAGTASPRDQARALLSLSAAFPARLAGDEGFARLVAGRLDDLCRFGARATVERVTSAARHVSSPA